MRLRVICVVLSAIFAGLCANEGFAQEPAAAAAPPAPAPRDASGKILFGGADADEKGIWLPVFAIGAHLLPLETIPFQPWAKGLYDARLLHQLEPHARCKASGFVRQFQTPYGVEIAEIEALEKVYIFDIGGPHTYRTIYMDGRAHPLNPEPANYGHSIGWWEGDTLVIDTVAYNQDFWLDRRGLPHTTQLHTLEKLTRINHDRIRYEITVDDPGAYSAPFSGEFELRWQADQELFEYVCQQANYADELMTGTQATSIERVSHIVP
jgi:hypothetical protein